MMYVYGVMHVGYLRLCVAGERREAVGCHIAKKNLILAWGPHARVSGILCVFSHVSRSIMQYQEVESHGLFHLDNGPCQQIGISLKPWP